MGEITVSRLSKLGFTGNESEVYLALARRGSADAHTLIRDTKLHKKVVYENLERLMDKGLVAFITDDGRKVFSVAEPHMLVKLFEDQEKEIAQKKEEANAIAKAISELVKVPTQMRNAAIYRGTKGIRTFYEELLGGKSDYVVFGAPGKSVEIMGEHFWKNFVLKKTEKKIKARLVFNKSLKRYGEQINDKYTSVRYFQADFEPLTETNVQEDRVGIIVWTPQPLLFIIQDNYVAETYRLYFEKLWKDAEK